MTKAEFARPYVFLWENFGPMHVERCEAVVSALGDSGAVYGIELLDRSTTYDWVPPQTTRFRKISLFDTKASPGWPKRFQAILTAARRLGRGEYFLCHYDDPAVMLLAWYLRLTGSRVYAMGCSKFDDFPRKNWREGLKALFFLPYHGGISSGVRGRDYFRFLGLRRVEGEYNTLSIERVRRDAHVAPAPGGTPFADRHFTIVARFVAKKNLAMAIDAYARYRTMVSQPRGLVLCGSGNLEGDLRARVKSLRLSEHVKFTGFLQADGIARVLGRSLALLLVSEEEQFGNVVIEAQAMGLPVLLSDVCGARDRLVRAGVNGFLIEPDNAEGLARLMAMLSEREELWRSMSDAALKMAPFGDVARFAEGVLRLTGRG